MIKTILHFAKKQYSAKYDKIQQIFKMMNITFYTGQEDLLHLHAIQVLCL